VGEPREATPAGPPLGETEQWFRTLAETTSTAIFVYRDTFLYVNRACVELTGYDAAELLGMEVWRLAHPDFQPAVRERMRARFAGQSPTPSWELRVIRKDGVERWMEINVGMVAMDGAPAAMATAIDVTERKLGELALRESGERLELAGRVAGAVTWEWNLLTDELTLSSYADEVLGFPAESEWPTGPRFTAAVHADDQPLLVAALQGCLGGGEDFMLEIRVATPVGERWLSERGRAVRDAAGTAIRMIGVAHDVTRQKLAQQALAEERERAQVTLASIGDGVIRTDSGGFVDYLNPVAERLTGWLASEAMGLPVYSVFNVVDEIGRRPLFSSVDRCLKEGRVIELPGRSLLLRRDGSEFAIRDSVAPIRDGEGRITGAVLVFKDVTELRGMEREMSWVARHDALTGLINRREFENRLQFCLRTAAEEGREHALFYLDLDEFKLVNDTAGHLAGDELLKQVTVVLSACLRKGDTLARLGGDEFGVILEDTEPARARAIAQDLISAVNAHRLVWGERIFEVSASLGQVMIGKASGDMGQVLSAADAACYVAKESGRNRSHLYQPDDTLVAERYGEMQWIHRIHKAFDEERFRLYRQAIEPLAPDGAAEPPLSEIFIRMLDEQGGLASPGAFIPAAERYHLIPSIDRWVVHAAFASLARGPLVRADCGTCFAVNLSGQSIGEASFLDYVLSELTASGIAPERICFEITETAAVANLARATRFIAVLKSLGCRFVLDDFGSGLSSFAYLKNLRVDFLKIDGEFVRGMVDDSVQRALVASIHQIGHVMGIKTIAESVENQETLRALRTIGVDYAQGYAIAPPEPLE
jgi:diguanylate cyclase (GGDEF)-like protein/PAS domain S-box-containing protein